MLVRFLLLAVCLLVIVKSNHGLMIPQSVKDAYNSHEKQLEYLTKYEFIGNKSRPGAEEEMFTQAIKDFQFLMGLPETGAVDIETRDLMASPRCGMHDNVTALRERGFVQVRRSKRYATVPNTDSEKWVPSTITARIIQRTYDVTEEEQQTALEEAVQVWNQDCGIQITALPMSDNTVPDLEILFAARKHCNWPGGTFDGVGGTLAHAVFPRLGGDIHMDEDEPWIVDDADNTNYHTVFINWVLAHEIGHSLGIDHSNDRNAIMYPTYAATDSNVALGQDDIDACQYLYGVNTDGEQPTDPPAPTDPPVDDGLPGSDVYCALTSVDAMATFKGRTYAFAGDNFYQINDNGGVVNQKGKILADEFTGVTGPIDAATQIGGNLYLFKGDKVYSFSDIGVVHQSERTTSDVFPCHSSTSSCSNAQLADFDDVMLDNRGKSYFLKFGDNKYFRRSSYSEGTLDRKYPKSTDGTFNTPDVPVDAMFTWLNGVTYLFSGTDYYRINSRKWTVSSGYPQNTIIAWFGCSAQASNLVASDEDVQIYHEDPTPQKVEDFDDFFGNASPALHASIIALSLALGFWRLFV